MHLEPWKPATAHEMIDPDFYPILPDGPLQCWRGEHMGDSRRMQVFYDGACPLCSREVEYYRRRDEHCQIEWLDIARPDFHAGEYGLDMHQLQRVMHVRMPDGGVVTQVGAFVKIWEALPPAIPTKMLRGVLRIPGMLALANVFYRAFARNRYRLTGRCTPETCATK
jgi:predicted DCC family thiol-disulfide oxidoreductase YuxK